MARLSGRGKRVVAAIAFLTGLGLLFLDPLILLASLGAVAFLLYDLSDLIMVSRRPGQLILTPSEVEARAIRGARRQFHSTLNASRAVALDASATPWVHPVQTTFPAGTWPFDYDLSSDFAGSFSLHGVPAYISSRYGLFTTRSSLPMNVNLRVYPRLVAAALAALEYLTRVGAGTEGEVERSILGPGMEYAETREYLPGDNLRRVDWKATARSDALMIKHYYSEGGGAVHIIYFVDAPGPRSHDDLATQLLDLVVSSAVRVTPVSVTAYEKGSRITTLEGKGWEVVVSTLNLVMAESKITYDDLYSLLDVASVSKERRDLLLAGRRKLADLLGRAGGKRQALVSDFRGLVAQLASPDVMSSFIILGTLVSNRDVLAEIIEDLRFRRAETTVVYPKDPWKDAETLAEAYTLQASQERMLKFVRSSGCLVGPIPLKLQRMTGIPSWAISASA